MIVISSIKDLNNATKIVQAELKSKYLKLDPDILAILYSFESDTYTVNNLSVLRLLQDTLIQYLKSIEPGDKSSIYERLRIYIIRDILLDSTRSPMKCSSNTLSISALHFLNVIEDWERDNISI